MSVRVLAWAWEQDLEPLTKLILLALADHCDHEGLCFPKIKTVMSKTGLGLTTVHGRLRILVKKNLIKRNAHFLDKSGAQTSNLISLLIPPPISSRDRGAGVNGDTPPLPALATPPQ